MRIAVLGSSTSWYLADLQRAAADRHDVFTASFESLSAEVDSDRVWANEVCLNDCDAVLVRSMPPGSLEQVVFRMNALARLEASGCIVLNSPRSLEIAIDKYLALTKLKSVGFEVPSTVCCQDRDSAMVAFERLGGDVVVKPLFGSEGRGMMRVDDADMARRVFATLQQLNAAIYLQKFIAHEGRDIRLLTIGDEVLCMERRHPTDWRTNVARGGESRRMEATEPLHNMAVRAAQSVGAELCALDLLPVDGRLYALEVNAVPGWKALAKVTKIDVATKVLQYAESTANRSASH